MDSLPKRPDRVWQLIMWALPAPEAAPNDPDDPWSLPGAPMGVFATREAALEELVEEIGAEALDERHWTQPGLNPRSWEWRPLTPGATGPTAGEVWFSLEHVPVRLRGGKPWRWDEETDDGR